MVFKKKLFSAVLAAGLVIGAASVSNATNGYYMIGTGAKSLGMAGAVVANPQDASTILQNPAGIAWLKGTTADIGGAAFSPRRKLNGSDSDSKLYVIPAAGFAMNPKGANAVDSNFTFGIGMYGDSGMGTDFADSNLGGTGALTKAWSNMAMMELAIGGAYRVNDKLSIGFSPVFVYQSMGFEMNFNKDKSNMMQQMGMGHGIYKMSMDAISAYGVGFNVGAVYKINDMIQLGFVYKSKRWMQKLKWNTTPDGMIVDDEVKMRLNMPRQVAFGVNVRPIEPLKIEADVRWINYHDVMDEVDIDGINPNLMTKYPFHWKNQWVFAVGAEYAATDALTLRAGFNYGKSPIKDEDVTYNAIATAVVETHATAGASYKITKNLEISAAYAHAFEHKQSHKNTGMMKDLFGSETEIKMYEDTVAMQMTYNF